MYSAREGKVETSWINPDEAYEAALRRLCGGSWMLTNRASSSLRSRRFSRRIALIGALNSLSQLALKGTMPGVPDFYQGTELWDLSLVDPDNRRPVDFAARAAALGEVAADPDWNALTAAWPDGRIKLALTRELLALRNAHPALFTDGTYQPIEVRAATAIMSSRLPYARPARDRGSGRTAVCAVDRRRTALALARRVGRAAGARGIRFAAQCAGAGEFGDHPWRGDLTPVSIPFRLPYCWQRFGVPASRFGEPPGPCRAPLRQADAALAGGNRGLTGPLN